MEKIPKYILPIMWISEYCWAAIFLNALLMHFAKTYLCTYAHVQDIHTCRNTFFVKHSLQSFFTSGSGKVLFHCIVCFHTQSTRI